jgi:hypothetical protein
MMELTGEDAEVVASIAILSGAAGAAVVPSVSYVVRAEADASALQGLARSTSRLSPTENKTLCDQPLAVRAATV